MQQMDKQKVLFMHQLEKDTFSSKTVRERSSGLFIAMKRTENRG